MRHVGGYTFLISGSFQILIYRGQNKQCRGLRFYLDGFQALGLGHKQRPTQEMYGATFLMGWFPGPKPRHRAEERIRTLGCG